MRTLAGLSTSPTALRRARIAQRSRGEAIIFFLSTANKMESNRVNCILRRRGEGQTDCHRQECLTARLGLSSAARSFAGAFCWADRTKTKRARPATPLNAAGGKNTHTWNHAAGLCCETRKDGARAVLGAAKAFPSPPPGPPLPLICGTVSFFLFSSSSFAGLAMVAVVLRASLGVCAFVAKRDSSISALYSVLDDVWCQSLRVFGAVYSHLCLLPSPPFCFPAVSLSLKSCASTEFAAGPGNSSLKYFFVS